jgi:uncharacterized membrane protein
MTDHLPVNRRPLVTAGLVLGMGLGGFVDGILFHQLFQLHSMVSARRPIRGLPAEQLVVNLEINMFWDGMFHLMTWTMTAVGIALLWSAVRRQDVPLATRTLVGSMLAGWGLFNLVEGIIDHHVIHLHHVIESAGHLPWDLAFLAFGALLLAAGFTLVWNDRQDARPRRTPTAT